VLIEKMDGGEGEMWRWMVVLVRIQRQTQHKRSFHVELMGWMYEVGTGG
jgi:hypothetical protein